MAISFPFRVTSTGRVATVAAGSVEQQQELLAKLLLVRPGERHLAPEYGLDDPAFGGFADVGLADAVRTFGPDVDLQAVEVTPVGDSAERVVVRFA